MNDKPITASKPAKPIVTSYCVAVLSMESDNVHRHYHDMEYGFPIIDDNQLFERLVLEINQAGLSWTTILKKKSNFSKAYDRFDLREVAKYKEKDVKRLISDVGIIRNRLKILAAVHNAQVIIELQNKHGSFRNWLDLHHPLSREEWTKLFKKTFKFTGGEIVNEFLMSTGYLEGAHTRNCVIYKKVLKKNPKWASK